MGLSKRLKESLFLKQFLINMTILLISFTLLGIVFTFAFRAYYMQQKKELLIQQADRISEEYALSIYTGIAEATRINKELRILAENLGASTILVARNGRVLFVSSDIDSEWIGMYVNEEELLRAINGETVVTERQIGNFFSDSALTVVYPIKADRVVFAALLMNISVPGAREQLFSVYLLICAVLAICGIVAFAALYFSVKKITKPLIELNKAAKVIADGDFEKRIETDLTDEVGQLAQSFNEMAESLNTLEQSKRQFITNISHDIRSPLTSIRGFATAMLDGTAPPESFIRYLNIIIGEAGRIIKLADEIIDLNGLSEGAAKINPSAFDINGLIRVCAEKYGGALKDKNIELELIFSDESILVNADADKIERVLENLIENAIKFTEEGKIMIEAEATGEKARISVKDTGIGLDGEEARRVFERFYKADESRGRNGNGLGLSIVKEIINAHGETVEVSSVKSEGTMFCFELPAGRVE